MNSLNAFHPLGVVRWLHEPQSTMAYPELGCPQCVGRYRSVGSPSWFPVCWRCRDMEGFLIRRWALNLPVSGATSALARQATLAVRWLHEPRPTSNHPLGVGFPHLAGRYRPGGSVFSSPGCSICRDMEVFLTWGWELIIPGCGKTSALARGATLAVRWLHEPQPISNHPVGLGFPHPAGRHRPGRSAFSSPGCWSCRDMEVFLTRGWELILPGCGGTSALTRGAILVARWFHEPQPISNHPAITQWGWGFHSAGRYQPCLLYTSPSPRD